MILAENLKHEIYFCVIMESRADNLEIFLEIGAKRTFAGAIDWPGWCRSGRNAAEAVQALVNYGPRYAKVLRLQGVDFKPPENPSLFIVSERLDGDATTDFGAPGKFPSADSRPMTNADLSEFDLVMKACWMAFNLAINAARGKDLALGPRGGGRELEQIIQHVLDSEAEYMSRVDWKVANQDVESQEEKSSLILQAILDGLAGSVNAPVAARGPRGGIRWTVRYFVRRTAWHMLDHTWEIEDRNR